MKNIFKYLLITCFIGILSGCEDYLSVPPDANMDENTIFTSYKPFQGYIDICYQMIIDNNNHSLSVNNNLGGESIMNQTSNPSNLAMSNQWLKIGAGVSGAQSVFVGRYGGGMTDVSRSGVYHWWPYGCRIANIALKNLPLLQEATEEQKKSIEGQALFFRAHLNFSVACAYGSIPYLDKVLSSSDAKMNRYWTDEVSGKKDVQAVCEKAARDLRRAADLLPVSWPENETGRITKGAALGLLSRVYLYAGSPLFEEAAVNGNSAITSGQTPYNQDYMRKAAEAAGELINMGVYLLPAWGSTTGDFAADGYRTTFCNNGTSAVVPYSSETILQLWNVSSGAGVNSMRDRMCRIYIGQSNLATGGAGAHDGPLQAYIDKFEMNDGSQYKPGNAKDGGYDDNFDKFTNQRDPRFQFTFRTHGEQIGVAAATPDFSAKNKNYCSALVPFYISKFCWPAHDAINGADGQFWYRTPYIRYADILLLYAEAVFEATGNPDEKIGTTITARQALNMVRNRANMPDYNPATYSVARTTHGELASDNPFRLAVRNERAVELAYEGIWWYDLRRWKRMHLLEDKLWGLDFNKDWTVVSRYVVQPFVYEMRNYWLPLTTSHTQIYEGFTQNPGW